MRTEICPLEIEKHFLTLPSVEKKEIYPRFR